MTKFLKFALTFYFVSYCFNALAQFSDLDIPNNTFDSLTQKLYILYSGEIAEASQILNGPEYFYDDLITGGNPFLGPTQFHDGSILYNGIRYEDQEIGYDIYRDEVFISRYDQDRTLTKVNLNDNKVDGFLLSDRRFVRLTESLNYPNLPGTGFFELIYSGNLKVFVRRGKKIITANDGGLYKYIFEISDKIYVLKDNTFHRITYKRSLLGLLSEEKKTLRDYIKQNRQDLQDLERFVSRICTFYDFIKKEQLQ